MSEKMIVACPKCETRFVAPLEKFLPTGRKVRCAKCGNAWFQNADGSATELTALAKGATGSAAAAIAPAAVTSSSAATAASASASAMPSPSAAPVESIMDRATRAVEKPSLNDGASGQGTPGYGGNRVGTRPTSDLATETSGIGASTADLDADAVPEDFEVEIDQTPPKRRKFRWVPRLIFYCIAAAVIASALGYFFKDEIVSKAPALDPPLTSWKQNVDAVVSKVLPKNQSLRIENVKYDIDETADETALLVTAEVANDGDALVEAPKLTVALYGENDALLKELSLAPEDISGEIDAEGRASYFLRMPFPPENLKRVEVDFAK